MSGRRTDLLQKCLQKVKEQLNHLLQRVVFSCTMTNTKMIYPKICWNESPVKHRPRSAAQPAADLWRDQMKCLPRKNNSGGSRPVVMKWDACFDGTWFESQHLFLFIFVLFTLHFKFKLKKAKHRCCAWDPNTGRAQTNAFSYGGRPNIEQC